MEIFQKLSKLDKMYHIFVISISGLMGLILSSISYWFGVSISLFLIFLWVLIIDNE